MMRKVLGLVVLLLLVVAFPASASVTSFVEGFYNSANQFAGTMSLVNGGFAATNYALEAVGNLPANVENTFNIGRQAGHDLFTWNTKQPENVIPCEIYFKGDTNRFKAGEPFTAEMFFGTPSNPLRVVDVPSGIRVLGAGPGYLAVTGVLASPGQYQITFHAKDGRGHLYTVVAQQTLRVEL